MQSLTWLRILWPSFLVGGAAETVFFTLFDPMDLSLFGEPVTMSRTAIYSLGFFLFWFFSAASSALTMYLQRSADEINLCPLPEDTRPAGCPNRDEPVNR
jgi:hypothetical protein